MESTPISSRREKAARRACEAEEVLGAGLVSTRVRPELDLILHHELGQRTLFQPWTMGCIRSWTSWRTWDSRPQGPNSHLAGIRKEVDVFDSCREGAQVWIASRQNRIPGTQPPPNPVDLNAPSGNKSTGYASATSRVSSSTCP